MTQPSSCFTYTEHGYQLRGIPVPTTPKQQGGSYGLSATLHGHQIDSLKRVASLCSRCYELSQDLFEVPEPII